MFRRYIPHIPRIKILLRAVPHLPHHVGPRRNKQYSVLNYLNVAQQFRSVFFKEGGGGDKERKGGRSRVSNATGFCLGAEFYCVEFEMLRVNERIYRAEFRLLRIYPKGDQDMARKGLWILKKRGGGVNLNGNQTHCA